MPRVEIRVKSHLDETWAEWLAGFTFTHTEQNETILTGVITDQAAFYGLMAKLRDLGLKLITVSFMPAENGSLEDDESTGSTAARLT